MTDPISQYQQSAGTIEGKETIGSYTDEHIRGDARRRNPKKFVLNVLAIPVYLALYNTMIWTIMTMFGADVKTNEFNIVGLVTLMIVGGLVIVVAGISKLVKYFETSVLELGLAILFIVAVTAVSQTYWVTVCADAWIVILNDFSEWARAAIRK